jgi:DUF917 family protein
MSRVLNLQDVKNILIGATLLGTGGGSSLEEGLKLVDQAAKKGKFSVKLVDVDEMEKDAYASGAACVGAPSAIKQLGFDVEAEYAFNAFKKLMAQEGKDLKYVLPGELGGTATAVPLCLAASRGMPVVDADLAGRAIPNIETTLAGVYGIPPSPMVLASKSGDVIVAYLADPTNSQQAETIARYVCAIYSMVIGLSMYCISREQIKSNLVVGSLTLCQKLGEAITKAKLDNADVIAEIKKVVRCKELFRGKAANLETKAKEGFDFGVTTLSGVDAFAGQTNYIDFKNENMIMRNEKKEVMAMVPDLICLVDLNQKMPVTNADTKEGDTLAVIGIPAAEPYFRTSKGTDCWKGILAMMEYTGGYKALKL